MDIGKTNDLILILLYRKVYLIYIYVETTIIKKY